MASQIDDYAKRPERYRNIDGLAELGVGVLMTALIPFALIKNVAPSSIDRHRFVVLTCVAALLVAVLYGIRALKARITYPRTGYVKYRGTRARVVAILLTVAPATIAWNFIFRYLAHHSLDIVRTALVSAAWGLVYVAATRMDAGWRWIFLIVLIVVPPVVATLPLNHSWSVTLQALVPGPVFFVSGAITLALYLYRNKLPEKAAE
jgi:hypothetical protein